MECVRTYLTEKQVYAAPMYTVAGTWTPEESRIRGRRRASICRWSDVRERSGASGKPVPKSLLLGKALRPHPEIQKSDSMLGQEPKGEVGRAATSL
jgi:hypothetical protein